MVDIDKATFWASVDGAAELVEIFGYGPTLHDATVERLVFNYSSHTLRATVFYNDLIEKPDCEGSATVRFDLVWCDVISARLRKSDPDLYGVTFSREEGWLITRFEPYSFGMDGMITARSLRVENVQWVGSREPRKLTGLEICIDSGGKEPTLLR